MIKNIIKKIILFLITTIEYFEYKNKKLDQKNINKKIIDTQYLEDIEVLTDTGWKKASNIHLTQPYDIYTIKTNKGKYLECADNHIIYKDDYTQIFVQDIKIGDKILTIDGIEEIVYKDKSNYTVSMYDLTVDSEEHRYYTNGILSHNTVISSIFLVWYLLFNFDRNVLLIANKGDTVKEIMEKVKSILEYLPFFLKPGILKKDVMNMKFDNNCRILGKATTKTSSIGFTVHLLYSDEFAHIPQNILTPLWKSMYPTLSSSKIAKIIITSTPNGFNLFHTLYQGSVDGLNSFKNIFVPWWFVKGRDEAWKQKEIANLGSEEAFNQEYGCQFLINSDLLLDADELQLLESLKVEYSYKDDFEFDFPVEGKHIYLEVNNNYNSISGFGGGNSYMLLTVDTSEGVGKDYSVCTFWEMGLMPFEDAENYAKRNKVTSVYNFITLTQVAKFSDNKIAPDKYAKIIYWLVVDILGVETTRLNIEANTFGGEVIRNLYNLYGEDNEFEEGLIFKFPHRMNSEKRYDGSKLNSENKRVFCNIAKRMINEKRVLPTAKTTIQQANFFTRDKNGSYKASTGNDDEWITVVHASTVFDNPDFLEFADEYIESIQDVVDLYEDLIDVEYKDEALDSFDDFFEASGNEDTTDYNIDWL